MERLRDLLLHLGTTAFSATALSLVPDDYLTTAAIPHLLVPIGTSIVLHLEQSAPREYTPAIKRQTPVSRQDKEDI